MQLKIPDRPKGRIGVLSTSKFYELGDGTMTFFYPEFSNIDQNWIAADVNIFIEEVQTELNYIQSHWNHPGRPTIVIPLSSELIWNTSDSCVHRLGAKRLSLLIFSRSRMTFALT